MNALELRDLLDRAIARHGVDLTVWLQGTPWSDGSYELDVLEVVERGVHWDPTQGPMVAAGPREDAFPVLVVLNPHPKDAE